MLRIIGIMVVSMLLVHTLLGEESRSLTEARALAARLKKPILIDFMTEW